MLGQIESQRRVLEQHQQQQQQGQLSQQLQPQPVVQQWQMSDLEMEHLSLKRKDTAQRHARDFRPTQKFGGKSVIDFGNIIARYEMAVENVGMDSRMKLLEMQHWFEGFPAKMIASFVTEPDADMGYAKARSKLQELFGGTSDSIVPLMEQLVSGKQLGKGDLDGHLQLLSNLMMAESTAQRMGQRSNLDSRDRIAKIIESRLKYFSNEYYKQDFDLRLEFAQGFDYGKLRDMVNRHVRILQQKQLMLGGQQQLKVNSTATAPQQQQQQRQQQQQQQHPQGKKSYSKALKESPKKEQSTESCNICKGMHATASCNQLVKLKPDDRVGLIKKHDLCFMCLRKGHILKFC